MPALAVVSVTLRNRNRKHHSNRQPESPEPTRAPALPLRRYRRLLRLFGQTSPPAISAPVLREIRGASVCDVGSGSGLYGFLMRSAWHFTGGFFSDGVDAPERLVAVDFSKVAIERARRSSLYDELLLATSTRLPLPDKSVDTALSVESLEHLFPCEVEPALRELLRVAKRRLVISTPSPASVVNVTWLREEIAEAEADPAPLLREEYLVLGGCVHKSSLIPQQLIDAGFHVELGADGQPVAHADSHVYWADVDEVKLERLGAIAGMNLTDYPSSGTDAAAADHKAAYVELLRESLAMRERVLQAQAERSPPLPAPPPPLPRIDSSEQPDVASHAYPFLSAVSRLVPAAVAEPLARRVDRLREAVVQFVRSK